MPPTPITLQVAVIDYILPIIGFFALAYLVSRLARPMSKRFRPLGRLIMHSRDERQETLRALIASAISVVAFIVAGIFSLSLFVSADTLVWMVGLFSAAFGLGARPFISDYLTGISFIFENTFDVGDKIELPLFPQRVEGIVEEVNLRVTRVRGMEGELFTMPNGDIRLVRNFSRGHYSPTSVTLTIDSSQLDRTLDKLEQLSEESMSLMPNLLEPLTFISKSGTLGDETELTVLAKARFGKGAELRTRLLALLQHRVKDATVQDEVSFPSRDDTHPSVSAGEASHASTSREPL